ncbi:hypothetical protein ACFP51_37110 [Streptomyces pratens]|uniref:Uncharacterized protein n=1 Tax=Streptomyces pratens TaxID=887456 RepID=A0ABW1M5B3_9ACTN
MTARRPWREALVRDQQFLPFGLDLLQLLGQLLGKRIQFAAASRDPLQPPHNHTLPRFPAYRPGDGS